MTAFWVEISVEADLEAVEAVSEILGRVAPTGTSVEPGFELVDEGLGARVGAGKPASPSEPPVSRGVMNSSRCRISVSTKVTRTK